MGNYANQLRNEGAGHTPLETAFTVASNVVQTLGRVTIESYDGKVYVNGKRVNVGKPAIEVQTLAMQQAQAIKAMNESASLLLQGSDYFNSFEMAESIRARGKSVLHILVNAVGGKVISAGDVYGGFNGMLGYVIGKDECPPSCNSVTGPDVGNLVTAMPVPPMAFQLSALAHAIRANVGKRKAAP